MMSQYMPHGHCYLWEPALVGTHVGSDMLIGSAYLIISVTLYFLIRKIKIPFSPIILAFGVFIAACGMTHFMEVWNLWNADYWLGGWVKILTALASVATCIALIRLSPKIFSFASAAQVSEERKFKLQLAYEEMEARVRDRTKDLEQAYATAQRSSRLKDEFLATMSHELRTPLSVILGYSELLEGPDLTENDKQQAIETIRRNAVTQFQLVKDLLDVSMIISGKMKLDPQVVDVKTPVIDAIESMSLAAKAKNIEIKFESASEALSVYGELTRLQQIVWNLISNAIKFTNKNGKVNVRTFSNRSKCCIEVTDTGQGIDPLFLPHIFERFSQEDASISRKIGGLGFMAVL